MKKTKMNITIGIPALNEADNIKNLLRDILLQKISTANLRHIIVASDGSTDSTVRIANSIKDSKIVVLDGKLRRGKAYRQNQIIANCNCDILVILDADISIKDPYCIEKLIEPIVLGKAQMTSSALEEMTASNFLEKTLDVSMKLKAVLFDTFRKGHNVYNCHGPARAFSREYFTKLRFTQSDGEDMYSYLRCRELGFTFKYVKKAVVTYKLPTKTEDHYKQSIRYHSAKQHFMSVFDPKFVESELIIPLAVYIQATFKALPLLLRSPLFVFCYVSLLASVKLGLLLRVKPQETWRIASSKLIRS